jgi:signal transduction histidine kinase
MTSENNAIKVLIIEDDDAYALLLRRMLEKAKLDKFIINRVNSLQASAEYIAKNKIDVILLDLYLPDGNGLDMLDAMRASVFNIPIIVLTSLDDDTIGIDVLKKGGQDYLVKSKINDDLLARSIRYAIERHNLLMRLRRKTKELEASEKRCRYIAENNIDAIIVVDHNKIVKFINPAGEAMFDRKSDDFVGRSFDFEFSPGTKLEIEIPKKDGQITIAEMRSVKIDWHGQEANLISLRDITESKQIERFKEEVISIVSHELRSPLTSILNSLNLLIDGEAGEIPEQAAKLLKVAHRSSERMLRLANDMLDIRKIESGQMQFNFQIYDLIPLIEQSIESNRAYAEQFGVKIVLDNDYSSDIKVNVDADRLMQIMTNLFTNASKFSPKDEKITVSITDIEDLVRISVKDKGPGIPEEFRSKIFDKFAQAQLPGLRRRDGSGLGLNISKMLVERMGGTINFITNPDEGATFFFDLPKYQINY